MLVMPQHLLWLDFVLTCLEKFTRKPLGAKPLRHLHDKALVCSHGVKNDSQGRGRNNLEHVFLNHLWFGLCVYPTWCGIVCLRSEW